MGTKKEKTDLQVTAKTEQEELLFLKRSNSSLKGVITQLNKRYAEVENTCIALQEELDKEKSLNAELREEKLNVERELDNARRANNRQNERITKFNEVISELRAQLDEWESMPWYKRIFK